MKLFFFLLGLVLALGGFSQNFIIFKGTLVRGSDSAFYCFDGNRYEEHSIVCDQKGNYTLRLHLNEEKTLSFYYANNNCEQVLDVKKLKSYIKNTGCQTIGLDLTLLKGFACSRTECVIAEENRVFCGNYKTLDVRLLTIEPCYYRLSYVDKEYEFEEEGEWTVVDKIITFKPLLIRNKLTGTYVGGSHSYDLRYERDKLIKANGDVDFFKK